MNHVLEPGFGLKREVAITIPYSHFTEWLNVRRSGGKIGSNNLGAIRHVPQNSELDDSSCPVEVSQSTRDGRWEQGWRCPPLNGYSGTVQLTLRSRNQRYKADSLLSKSAVLLWPPRGAVLSCLVRAQEHFMVRTECFASPLNRNPSNSFCSIFPDTDKCFGEKHHPRCFSFAPRLNVLPAVTREGGHEGAMLIPAARRAWNRVDGEPLRPDIRGGARLPSLFYFLPNR